MTRKSFEREAGSTLAQLLGPEGEILREHFTPERLAALKKLMARIQSDDFRSHAEREASRRRMLAQLGDGEDLWVFAYGSLMWNPAVHIVETQSATAYGVHRAFCLNLELGRGTPKRPGLMLGLDRGGSCRGVAHRVSATLIESETEILWMREMVGYGYEPGWVYVHMDGGRRRALTFLANPHGPRYVGRLPHEQMVERIAHAEGPLGSNRHYLYQAVAHLHALGITDGPLHHLCRAVREKAGD